MKNSSANRKAVLAPMPLSLPLNAACASIPNTPHPTTGRDLLWLIECANPQISKKNALLGKKTRKNLHN
jgi:hypothetical protein